MKYLRERVGGNIRKQRITLGINQEKLAWMAGIDRSYMGRIERGEVNITLDKLYRLLEALQCEPEDVLPSQEEYHNMREAAPHTDKDHISA